MNELYEQIINIIPSENNNKAYHEWTYKLDDDIKNINILRYSKELQNELSNNGKYKIAYIKNMYEDACMYDEHIDRISPYSDCIIYMIL